MSVQAWLRTALATGMLAFATIAAAQQSVSPSDIQRLQDQVFQAGSELTRLRATDASLVSRLESDLDELRDEVTYLKVKIRKEGSVSRSEYADLRDRLQEFRTRARAEFSPQPGLGAGGSAGGSAGTGSGVSSGSSSGARPGGVSGGVYDDQRPAQGQSSGGQSSGGQSSGGQSSGQSGDRSAIPVGQEIDVRLQRQLSSDDAQVEDRFDATTLVHLYRGDDVLIPAGSVMRGVVSSVNRASRTDRKGTLTLAFDQVTIDGRSYPMRGTVTRALESEGLRGEAGRIGAGSAVGAIIGGIVGGVRGALLGVAIGGGGTILATEGSDVTLPAGTVLTVRLDTPPNIR